MKQFVSHPTTSTVPTKIEKENSIQGSLPYSDRLSYVKYEIIIFVKEGNLKDLNRIIEETKKNEIPINISLLLKENNGAILEGIINAFGEKHQEDFSKMLKNYGIDDDKIKKILNSKEGEKIIGKIYVEKYLQGDLDERLGNFLSKFNFSSSEFNKIIKSQNTKEEIVKRFINILKKRDINLSEKVIDRVVELNKNLPQKDIKEIFKNEEVKQEINQFLYQCLKRGLGKCARDLVKDLKKLEDYDGEILEIKKIKDGKNLITQAIARDLEKGKGYQIKYLEELLAYFGSSEDEVKKIMQSKEIEITPMLKLKNNLIDGKLAEAICSFDLALKTFEDKNEFKKIMKSEEIKDAIYQGVIKESEKAHQAGISNLKDLFSLMRYSEKDVEEIFRQDKVRHAMLKGVLNECNQGHYGNAICFLEELEKIGVRLEAIDLILKKFECENLDSLTKKGIDKEFLSYLIEHGVDNIVTPSILGKHYESKIVRASLLTIQKEYERTGSVDFLNDKLRFYNLLKAHDVKWQDRINITEPFEEGIKYFGVENMFKYLEGRNANLHDALYNFKKICELCDISKIDKQRFFHNILAQVVKDNGLYEKGSSYNHLNYIANEIVSLKEKNISIEKILKKIKKLDLPNIDEFVARFKNKEDVFSSWNDLKNFMKLKELIDNKEFIEKLNKLKKCDEKLVNFVSELLFNKDSKVSTEAVLNFLDNPEKFFSKAGKFSPSTYFECGLTAEELRKALVSGVLDELQVIKPCEIVYEVREKTIQDALKEALGQRKLGIKGKARDAKRLFHMLKNEGINSLDVIEGRQITLEEEQKIWEALDNEKYGMPVKKYKIKAIVHKKSDPSGALVGDATACCMPFGSAKMNEYLFNPANAIFSIKLELRDGTFKTIAQSVLTVDIDTGKPIKEIEDNIAKISHDIFKKSRVLVCDNIEVAPNYQDFIPIIESTYGNFFGEYLKDISSKLNLEKNRVVIGEGNNDALWGLERITNTFLQSSRIGYTDNFHETSLELPLDKKFHSSEFKKLEKKFEEPKKENVIKEKKYRIDYFDICDVVKIAYMEDRIYGHGNELKSGIEGMQAQITANLIKNKLKGTPIFMYKLHTQDVVENEKNGWMPLGYFIAHERENGKKEKEVYIADYAVLAEYNGEKVSNQLLFKFMKQYISQYKNEKKFPPIAMEAREATSYKFLTDIEKLNKVLSNLGLRVNLQEEKTEKIGDDNMHFCRLFVDRI